MSGTTFREWLSAPYWSAVPTLYGWVHHRGQPIYFEWYEAFEGETGRAHDSEGERPRNRAVAGGGCGPAPVRATAKPVLLLEGLGYSSWMWFRLLPLWVGRHPLLVVDNRGVGGSARAVPPESIEEMADDAAQVLQALRAGAVHVVGVSMGGFIAQALALRHPQAVASLALVVTSAGGPDPEPAPASAVQAISPSNELPPEQAVRRAMQVAASRSWWETNQAVIDQIVRWRLSRPVRRQAWLAQWRAAQRFDYRDRCRSIRVPTLVVAATDDRVMPPAHPRALARRIPQARLVEAQGSGHWVFIERAEWLAAEFERWLGQVEVSGLGR